MEIPLHVQPSLVLSVETDELGIVAGLQDRVIQVYEGLVYMDFAREVMRRAVRSAVRGLRAAGSRRCCRRCIWPTVRRTASRRRCCTVRCGCVTSTAIPKSHAAMRKFAELTVAARAAARSRRRAAGPADR